MLSDQHERYEDDVGAYLLDALSADEARAFEQHLDGCERCRLEIARLRTAAEALPRSVDPVDPPGSLKRSLMRTVRDEATARSREERRGGTSFGWIAGLRLQLRPLVASAAVLLIAGIAIGYGVSRGHGGGTRVVVGEVSSSLGPTASARLVVPSGHQAGAVLNVAHLPAPPPGYIYEVWLKRGGDLIPESLFSVRPDGRGAAAIGQSLAGVGAVLVTREHAKGAAAPTSAPVIQVRT